MTPLWEHLLVIAIVLHVVLPSGARELMETDCRLVAGRERVVIITVHRDFIWFVNTTHRVGPV